VVPALYIFANLERERKNCTQPPIKSIALALHVLPIQNHGKQQFFLLALNRILRIPAPLGIIITVAQKFDQPLKLGLVVVGIRFRPILSRRYSVKPPVSREETVMRVGYIAEDDRLTVKEQKRLHFPWTTSDRRCDLPSRANAQLVLTPSTASTCAFRRGRKILIAQ
jgi:hypothetical protein